MSLIKKKNIGARVAASSLLLIGLAALSNCVSPTTLPPDESCNTGQLLCGSYCCPDDTHYTCDSGECRLIGCDTDLQLCGTACIPITADCCNATGEYCSTGEVCCSPNACIPIGTSCCGGGKFCPVGKVCCSNGTQCC